MCYDCSRLTGRLQSFTLYLCCGYEQCHNKDDNNEVFEKLRILHTTTSPRAHLDPELVWAVEPGRADAPRIIIAL